MPSIPVKESAQRNESGKPDNNIQQPSDLPETASFNVLDGGNNEKSHSNPIQPNPLSPQSPGFLKDDFFFFFTVLVSVLCMHVFFNF